MTIHTFEVSSNLTNDEFYIIQKELKASDPSSWKALKNGMQYWGLSEQGILINMHQVKKKGFYTYYIIYRISARRVIENDNFVELFNVKNYPVLEDKVNAILKRKCSFLPKLKKCKLKRIDFCINAELNNQEQVKAYIKTIKRANIPSKLELYEEYDKISKRKKPTKDDFTVYTSEYVAVSIYNKYMAMKKQGTNVYPKKEIEKAKNIVRIEIRCMEGKVRALKKKYDIETIADFMQNGKKIGNELFKYYLSKICNDGMIYTLKEALKRIELSGYKDKTKSLLKEFISDSNEARSVAEVFKIYKNFYGKSGVKNIVHLLDDIETNYVTVTTSDSKLFEDRCIPTPLELFKEYR